MNRIPTFIFLVIPVLAAAVNYAFTLQSSTTQSAQWIVSLLIAAITTLFVRIKSSLSSSKKSLLIVSDADVVYHHVNSIDKFSNGLLFVHLLLSCLCISYVFNPAIIPTSWIPATFVSVFFSATCTFTSLMILNLLFKSDTLESESQLLVEKYRRQQIAKSNIEESGNGSLLHVQDKFLEYKKSGFIIINAPKSIQILKPKRTLRSKVNK